MGLRERLIEAKLTSHTFRASDGHLSLSIHTQEEAADLALTVVAAWLRDEADMIEQADLAREGRVRYAAEDAANQIRDLADSITGSTDG